MNLIVCATVRNAHEFAKCATRAAPGQMVTYQIGNLAVDRATHAALLVMAETVQIFSERGFIATAQATMRPPLATVTSYSAARTDRGYAPRSTLPGQCDPLAYRALQAMQSRSASKSATNAIRDFMGCPEATAAAYLAILTKRNWVEPAEPKGIRLTAESLRMLS